VIELQGVQKVVGQNVILDVASLSVDPGEVAALVGAAGSGTDVVLDLLIGRMRPTAGQVRVAGVDPALDRASFSRRAGVLFAEDTLYSHRSVRANLTFHSRLYGLPPSRVDAVLAKVGLLDHAEVRVGKLPSGLARRLAFGRALLHEPQVLLLVDPFARCDQASIQLLGRLVRERAEAQVAVLILAPDEAHLSLCDAIHVLEGGRISRSRHPEAEQAFSRLKIPVRLEDRVALVNPGDILYALAHEGRTYLQTVGERLPTQFTLSELEERLARSGFFRAHRSYLVNLQHVKEVIPYTRNSYTLILDDGGETEIPLSKGAANDLRELLGY
jgi:ABC-2 type transport system ATP-binding protein